MERRVQHTAHLDWPFAEVCAVLENRGSTLLAEATKNAAADADNLVVEIEADLHFFHLDEDVSIVAGHLVRHSAERASLVLDWRAETRTRVLPNIDADLIVHAIIPRGQHAVTAISIVGNFAAPHGLIRGLEQVWFTRRVLDRVVVSFIDSLVRLIELELNAKSVTKPDERKASSSDVTAA
ncbi:MAG: hypothetical protein ACI8TP_003970 [Acidimicrobiales bacterium]|jgi:hypothetical protein